VLITRHSQECNTGAPITATADRPHYCLVGQPSKACTVTCLQSQRLRAGLLHRVEGRQVELLPLRVCCRRRVHAARAARRGAQLAARRGIISQPLLQYRQVRQSRMHAHVLHCWQLGGREVGKVGNVICLLVYQKDVSSANSIDQTVDQVPLSGQVHALFIIMIAAPDRRSESHLRTATQRRTVVRRAGPRSSAAVFSSRATAGRRSWYRSVPVRRWIACAPRTAADPIVVPAQRAALRYARARQCSRVQLTRLFTSKLDEFDHKAGPLSPVPAQGASVVDLTFVAME